MIKNRQAFIFDEKYFNANQFLFKNQSDESLEKTVDNYIDKHIQISTHGLVLIPVIETFAHFYCEKMKTKELEKRLNYRKKALDTMVNEARNQVEIEIEEYRKRKEEEIQYNRKMLEVSIEELKREAQFIGKKNTNNYIKNKNIKEILNESRKQIKENLRIISELILDSEKNNLNRNKYYNQLNEEYRKQLKEYKNLILKEI